MCVNDVIIQLSVDTLPFGGVEESGYGAYHGQYTYDTFCHKKSILIRDFGMIGEKLGDFRYPPYTRGNIKTFRTLMELTHLPTPPGWLKYLLIFGFGIGIGCVVAWKSKAIMKELAKIGIRRSRKRDLVSLFLKEKLLPIVKSP